MLITQKITLDLMRSGVPPVVNVMQADTNTRTVEASLYVGGVPFSLAADEDVTISVAYKKPDGTGGWYDVLPDGSTAATITGNVVTAKLAPQVLSVPGTVTAALRIENVGETHRVSTFPFVIQVEADPGIGAIKSENYYNVQNWDDVNRNIDELWAAVNSGAGGGEAVPGGYYLPSVTQPNASQMKVSYSASQPGMPSVSPVSVNLPAGPKGDPGLTPHIGANGNWWIGTTDTGVSAGGSGGGGTAEGAVLYTSQQELTPAQQKQARDNIGAIESGHNFPIVNISNNASGSILWLSSAGSKTKPVLYLSDSLFQNVVFSGIAPGTDDTDAVNVAQLNEAVGSIDAALDSILAIQAELRGTITFTVNNVDHTALFGMTWAEWCLSEYNTIGAYIEDDGRACSEDQLTFAAMPGEVYQYGTTAIVDGSNYISV